MLLCKQRKQRGRESERERERDIKIAHTADHSVLRKHLIYTLHCQVVSELKLVAGGPRHKEVLNYLHTHCKLITLWLSLSLSLSV